MSPIEFAVHELLGEIDAFDSKLDRMLDDEPLEVTTA